MLLTSSLNWIVGNDDQQHPKNLEISLIMSVARKQNRSGAEVAPATRPIAVAQSLKIFSDSWSFAVLQEIFFGVRRFDDFQRSLGISRSVLTRRLRHLEEQEIIRRTIYSARPKRYEYMLTERGIDMYPIFVLLRQWGERWLENSRTDELHLTHKSCGEELNITLHCRACGDEVSARDVTYTIDE